MRIAKYYGILLLSSLLAVSLSYAAGWREGDWPQSSAVFACLVIALSFLFAADEPSIRNIYLAFLLYGTTCMVMMIVALAYWDGPSLITDLLAGPFERIGYFPSGDAWFPASALIWGISTFLLSISAFTVGGLLRRLLYRRTR